MKFKVMLFALAMSALMCAPSIAGILDRGCSVCGEVVDECGVCEACDACDACDSCDTRTCDLFGGLKSLFPGRRAACDPCGVEPCDEVGVADCGVCDEVCDVCGECGACDACGARRPLITLPKIELPKLRRPLCGDGCDVCGEVAEECGVCDDVCGECGAECGGRRVRLPRLGLINMLDDLLCGDCGDCGACDECGVCDDVPVCEACGAPIAQDTAVQAEAIPQVLPVSP